MLICSIVVRLYIQTWEFRSLNIISFYWAFYNPILMASIDDLIYTFLLLSYEQSYHIFFFYIQTLLMNDSLTGIRHNNHHPNIQHFISIMTDPFKIYNLCHKIYIFFILKLCIPFPPFEFSFERF